MAATMHNNIFSKTVKYLETAFFSLIILLLFPVTAFAQETPSLTLSPENLTVAVGSTIDVNIYIDTGSNEVGGAGAKLNYDPKVLSVVSIETGDIFADYPTVYYDNALGKITISGIVSSQDNLYSGTGMFATITFKGVSIASTDVVFEFEKGSTTDSNIAVTYAPGDILEYVNSLEVTVEEGDESAVEETLIATPVPVQVTPEKVGLLERVKRFLGLTEDKKTEIDPYAPIISQAPNTFRVPYTNPPLPQSLVSQYGLLPFLVLILVLLIVIVILLRIYLKRKSANTSKAHVVNRNV